MIIMMIIIIQTFWDFGIETDHLISARRPHLVIVIKKQRTYQIVDFDALADHSVKLKEREIST